MLKIFFFLSILFTLPACSISDVFEDSSSSQSVNADCGTMNELSCEMFKVVNSYRLQNGQLALKPHARCTQMAQDHARDMFERNYFSHNSPTETFEQRAARYGLTSYAGENIAMGSEDVNTIFRLWQNSSGHNANMLRSIYNASGIGHYQGYWVQCFTRE